MAAKKKVAKKATRKKSVKKATISSQADLKVEIQGRRSKSQEDSAQGYEKQRVGWFRDPLSWPTKFSRLIAK